MKNILTYEHVWPENFSFWEWLWPDADMRLDPEALRSSLEYYYRIRRLAETVDSEVGPICRMAFVCSKPGRYVLSIGK